MYLSEMVTSQRTYAADKLDLDSVVRDLFPVSYPHHDLCYVQKVTSPIATVEIGTYLTGNGLSIIEDWTRNGLLLLQLHIYLLPQLFAL